LVIIPAAWPQGLNFLGMPLVVEPSAGQLSDDAGLLPIRQLDQRIGLTPAYAESGNGPFAAGLTEHSLSEGPRPRRWHLRWLPGPGRPRQPIGLLSGAAFGFGR
jgi:hypothetical protein